MTRYDILLKTSKMTRYDILLNKKPPEPLEEPERPENLEPLGNQNYIEGEKDYIEGEKMEI